MGTEYPPAPVVGVGGVVVRGDRTLIVRRAREPRRGEWSIPGGRVELGEPLRDAVRRELREETRLDVRVGRLLEVFDRIDHGPDGRVRHHFVIVDFLCHAPAGDAVAGSDADEVAWVRADELDAYGVSPHAAGVIRKALALSRPWVRPPGPR